MSEHVMAVMDPKAGDLKVIWDPNNEDEVAAAADQFTTLRKKGYLAYTVDSRGKKGTQITEFDPTAEKIILAPALRGG